MRPILPKRAKILAVGEAPGEQEELLGVPFCGKAGQELTVMLREAGILRAEVGFTNVFTKRPPGNQILEFCIRGRKNLPPGYSLPQLQVGYYVDPKYLELDRLKSEIKELEPNLVLALGNVALWALCGVTGIGQYRGFVLESTLVPGQKVLPTYHPAAVLRAWDLRSYVLADLMKAVHESECREINYSSRRILIQPTRDEVVYTLAAMEESEYVAFDIETIHRTIECIGFSHEPDTAIVIPFVSQIGNYWKTIEDEIAVWRAIRKILSSPVPKVGHNGIFDIQYLGLMGIRVENYLHDTMLLHHSMHPEMLKSLSFLGSVYTNERAWKKMRPRGSKALKRYE
jgi:DNA polymerase